MGWNPFGGKGNLDGKVVLVTGAARGIGAGLAERFAARGAKVALVVRSTRWRSRRSSRSTCSASGGRSG